MGDTAVIAGYNILMAGCLPLIFYTPWVYGDIPSIFFAMLAQEVCSALAQRGCRTILSTTAYDR